MYIVCECVLAQTGEQCACEKHSCSTVIAVRLIVIDANSSVHAKKFADMEETTCNSAVKWCTEELH